MKDINLCTVVMGNTMDDIANQIILCGNTTRFIEVRSDYLNDQNNIDFSLIKNSTSQEIIFTCRRCDEGGKCQLDEYGRMHILQSAFTAGFLVDVELKTLEEGKLTLTSSMQAKTIVSFHDFKKTPDLSELHRISKRMDVFRPHIKKIATMVRDEDDNKTLLNLLSIVNKEERLCVIGMGEKGRLIRVISPLLGGELTYCSINIDRSSAPGQMTCATMKKIYRLLQ